MHDTALNGDHRPIASDLPDLAGYKRYIHALRAAYRVMGLAPSITNEALHLPPPSIAALPHAQALEIAVEAMRRRLSDLNPRLLDAFLEQPRLKPLTFNGRRVYIPIINQEGLDWYASSPMMNFDFLVESFHGMHHGARVIYDIGGHQGVWALYYATCIPEDGRVYTFEPSIINVEIAALSFFLNGVDNVNIIPAGIGTDNVRIGSTDDGLLISGPSHNINLMKLDWILPEPPDFMKIDIEGYEHELIQYMPDIFDFCENLHLEIHVPHLVARGVDYREIYDKIPFDRVDVVLSVWGDLRPLGPEDELTEFSTLLITPKAAR